MKKKFKKLLTVFGRVLLDVSVVGVTALCIYLLAMCDNAISAHFLTKISNEFLAYFVTKVVFLAVILALSIISYVTHKICSSFTEKITENYQSFEDEVSNDSVFSEVYSDPTVKLKDKILFFSIYSIYSIQLPFLYCASKASKINIIMGLFPRDDTIINMALVLINAILLIPVLPLELIKYPLIKLFSQLYLKVKQLSFLFNVSDVSNSSYSVHTKSFEHSIIQCAQELKQKFSNPPLSLILDKEFTDYINASKELTDETKEQLKNYLNFDSSNTANWRESSTGLTLTQAANLVLTAAKDQRLDTELLKCMLLIRLQEGNNACFLGMFNRIIYSLSCFEAKNNFTVEVNSQVYEKMPNITEEFLKGFSSKQIKILKENFNDFYCGNDINDKVKSNIELLMTKAKTFVFNRLYVDYYKRYGEEVGRDPIKQKLKELISDDEIKEAISSVIDGIEIPTTFFERVKMSFFGSCTECSPS